jgi:hypothetical protein
VSEVVATVAIAARARKQERIDIGISIGCDAATTIGAAHDLSPGLVMSFSDEASLTDYGHHEDRYFMKLNELSDQ